MKYETVSFRQTQPMPGNWVIVLLMLLHCAGCSRFASTDWNWFAATEETQCELPERILPIWTDTILHQPNQRGVRGFGGRVYFYRDGEDEPIPIDGNVTVYVFAGDYETHDSSRPLKKYVFTSEHMKNLASKSTLGFSYNIWIPWDEVGGPSRKLNLITRFDGTNGGTVISSSATKLLPGIDALANTFNASQQADFPKRFDVVQAGYLESEEIRPLTEAPATTIFTIELPSSLERKVNADLSEITSGDPAAGRLESTMPAADSKRIDPVQIREPKSPPFNGTRTKKFYGNPTGEADRQKDSPVLQQSTPVTLGKVGSQARVTGSRLKSRSGSRRFPAQNAEVTRQDSFLLRKQPHPAGWQNGLPPTPRSNR